MKTLLVPTDFSENAVLAMNYAAELAKEWNARLILFHAYEVPYATGYVSFEALTEEKKSLQASSEKKMKALVHQLHHEHLAMDSVCVDGDLMNGIAEVVEKYKVSMIVMGTKGASNLANIIFGSNTSHVIEKAHCPVLAIPDGTAYAKLKNITYATAYESGDLDVIQYLISLAKPFHAQINILHITENSEEPVQDKHQMKKFMDLLMAKIDYNNISFQVMDGANMEETLSEYIEQGSADMLVLSTHHRGFFGRIFGKHVTRQMSYHNRVPLMAFHYLSDSSVKLF